GVLRLALRPDVPVAVLRIRVRTRGLEPWVVGRGVVDDQVGNNADAELPGLPCEIDEIAERAVARINAVIVSDVVAVVTPRRRIEGQQPDAGNDNAGQVGQPITQPAEIADAIVVAVGKGADVQAIKNGVLVPEVDHERFDGSTRTTRTGWCT